MAGWSVAGDAMTEDRVIACAVTDEMTELSALTVPKMRAYAKRCSARFVLFDGMPDRFQDPKYRMFEAGELQADRALLLDADIVVRDSAPDIFEAHPTGSWMFDEGTIRRPGWGNRYRDRIMAEVAACPGMPTLDRNWGPEWWNPGVSLLDGGVVSELYVMPPWNVADPEHLWDSPMEKTTVPAAHVRIKHIAKNMPWLNWRIRMLGLPMRPLDVRWNTLINGKTRIPAAYFWHCTGSENDENRPARKAHMIRLICRNNREPLPCAPAPTPPGSPPSLVHVHFVCANLKPPWILERMQAHIRAAAPKGIRVTTSLSAVDEPYTINYYNPYRHWKGKSRRALDVVFCTHPEREQTFYASARAADAVVMMCNQYRAGIIGMGVQAERVHVIHPGVDDRYKDTRLRVFAPSRMDYACARKGPDVWKRLSGETWLDCVTSNGRMTEEELLTEYRRCDVVVSTATLEGGPMSVIEGLALGKPVVARAGVGWVDEFPEVMKYQIEEQLLEVLRDLHAAKQRRAESVARYTWAACAAAHWDLFRALAPEIGRVTKGPVPATTKRQRRRELATVIGTWTVAGTIPPGVLSECVAQMQRLGWEYTEKPTADLIVDAERLNSPSGFVRNRALRRLVDETAPATRR
jgi:glycosyltransferase involved in cell wall biosynthesis